jgi:hypothetical protein
MTSHKFSSRKIFRNADFIRKPIRMASHSSKFVTWITFLRLPLLTAAATSGAIGEIKKV